MTVAARPLFDLDAWFARDLSDLALPWRAAPSPDPRLVVLNEAVAAELGVSPEALREPEAAATLVGTDVPEGATPVAQAYSGHQFGNYSPRLGDGRALLLGEVTDTHGRTRDLHLKGSGRTPFARGGDGKAPLAPMLREYVISEAMAALGIPTTRSLAVLTTGEPVTRESVQPGAVLVRVAASHLRVGSFQFAAALDAQAARTQETEGPGSEAAGTEAAGTAGPDLVRRVADHAIARHHPAARDADEPYLALLDAVVGAQADLVARWMLVGFVHGVMNTDNMTISGETIDYGPCAFLDAFDPHTVYSSIDHGGRYAYANQPAVAAWNLARLAETLVPLIAAGTPGRDTEAAVELATETVRSFVPRYGEAWSVGMHAKLGLAERDESTDALVEDLMRLMSEQKVDHTAFFRALSDAARGDTEPARSLVTDLAAADAWIARWRSMIETRPVPAATVADGMDRVNPAYVPRNHLVEESLTAAVAGDLDPFRRLLDALTRPFDVRPGLERYAAPGPGGDAYVTYCGT